MNILDTIKRALRLDMTLYPEVEQKFEYHKQAIIIIIIISLFSSVGTTGLSISNIIFGFIYELLACAFWVGIIVIIALKVLDIRAVPLILARCIAIALSPLLLMLLALIPYIGAYLAIAGIILSIISVFRVVRDLLEIEHLMALMLSMIGSIPYIVVNFYLGYQ